MAAAPWISGTWWWWGWGEGKSGGGGGNGVVDGSDMVLIWHQIIGLVK